MTTVQWFSLVFSTTNKDVPFKKYWKEITIGEGVVIVGAVILGAWQSAWDGFWLALAGSIVIFLLVWTVAFVRTPAKIHTEQDNRIRAFEEYFGPALPEDIETLRWLLQRAQEQLDHMLDFTRKNELMKVNMMKADNPQIKELRREMAREALTRHVPDPTALSRYCKRELVEKAIEAGRKSGERVRILDGSVRQDAHIGLAAPA